MSEDATPRSATTSFTEEADEAVDSVVVGIDESVNAEIAAWWAAAEAERLGARLIVVHAMSDPGALTVPYDLHSRAAHHRATGGALLDRELASLRVHHPGLAIRAQLSDLSPAAALTAYSRTAALVVTGTRGHGGFAGMLVGSVSRKLAAHAACPLVVVHAEQPHETNDEVIVGIGRKPSPDAVGFAFAAARRLGATLKVVRAWWPHAIYHAMTGPGSQFLGELDTVRENAMEGLDQAVADIREEYPDIDVHLRTVEGNAVDVLVNAARNARLLVIGGHRRRGPLSIGPGYVVEGVIAHSPAPVAVVPVH